MCYITTTTTVYTVDRLVLHPQCPNNVIGDHFPFPFAAAAEVSPLPVGCRVDASASHRLDSASASKRATLAYRGPVASCPLAPLLPFASRTPAGCCLLLRASASRHLSSHSRRTRPSSTPPLCSRSSTPPLCSRQLVVTSNLFALPPPLDAPSSHDWLCRC
jgi:hypothetical protein